LDLGAVISPTLSCSPPQSQLLARTAEKRERAARRASVMPVGGTVRELRFCSIRTQAEMVGASSNDPWAIRDAVMPS